MNKKLILLAASLLSIGAVTTAALLNSNYKINAIQADESVFTLTFDVNNFDGYYNNFSTYSSNGNKFWTSSSNSEKNPGDNVMYSLSLSSSGSVSIYQQFQSINSVTVTYAFCAMESGAYATFYLAETNTFDGETMKINNESEYKRTATITALSPSNCHYFKLKARGSSQDGDVLNIYSITVNYTCA